VKTIKALQSAGVPTSYIVGRKTDGSILTYSNLAHDVKNDTHILNIIDGVDNKGKLNSMNDIKEIISKFKYFFIAEGDTLKVANKSIDLNAIKHLFKRIV